MTTAVPNTNLPAFFTGFPVVIKTTPTFEPGASISSLDGVPLSARIVNDQVTINASITVNGGEVTMVFAAATLVPGSWKGMLSYPDGPLATFGFVVERSP